AQDRVRGDRLAQLRDDLAVAPVGEPALHARGGQHEAGPRDNGQTAADEPAHHTPSTTSYFQPRNVPLVSRSATPNGVLCSGAGAVTATVSEASVAPPSPRIVKRSRTCFPCSTRRFWNVPFNWIVLPSTESWRSTTSNGHASKSWTSFVVASQSCCRTSSPQWRDSPCISWARNRRASWLFGSNSRTFAAASSSVR